MMRGVGVSKKERRRGHTAPMPIIDVYSLSLAFLLTVLMNVVVLASLVGTRSVITKILFSLPMYFV